MLRPALAKFQSTLSPRDRSLLDAFAAKLLAVNRGRWLARPVETWSGQIARLAPWFTSAECHDLAIYVAGVSGTDQDLQEILAGVKAINNAKNALRKQLQWIEHCINRIPHNPHPQPGPGLEGATPPSVLWRWNGIEPSS
jgi:hypothetical protein